MRPRSNWTSRYSGWRGTGASPVRPGQSGAATLLLGSGRLLRGCHGAGLNAEVLLHFRFHFRRKVGVILQIELRVLAPLADALLAVGVPGARFLDDPHLGRDVHEQRLVADPLVEHDVELRLSEWRPHLVLPYLHPYVVADHHLPVLHRPP